MARNESSDGSTEGRNKGRHLLFTCSTPPIYLSYLVFSNKVETNPPESRTSCLLMTVGGIMLCMQRRAFNNEMSYRHTGSRIHAFLTEVWEERFSFFFFFFWLICSPYRAAYFYPQLLEPFLPKDEIQLHLIIRVSSFPVRLSPALRKSTSAYSPAPSLVITD